jgi:hypothetical protein
VDDRMVVASVEVGFGAVRMRPVGALDREPPGRGRDGAADGVRGSGDGEVEDRG